MLIDNNPPPLSADTHDHAGRRPSASDAALAARPIASTASAVDEPGAPDGNSAPSNACAHRQKCPLLTFPWVFHRGSGGQSPASLSIARAISAAGE